MSEPAEVGAEVFGPEDLEPAPWEEAAAKRARWDKLLVVVACTALGIWVGGLVALGACAAPMVFRLAPAPFSGYAMGAAFERFDSIAVACSLCVLACELGRGIVGWRLRARGIDRFRRYLSILLAMAAVYGAVALTPRINAMFQKGIRRGVEPGGAVLEALHQRAEMLSKAVVPVALLMLALQVLTLRSKEELEKNEADEVLEPAAPGPMQKSA